MMTDLHTQQDLQSEATKSLPPVRVLNLYAGIGGNRKLWENVEVTSVELDPDIAAVYADLFPDDTLIVGDAHQYLLDHYQEFDFIWSSPPCPSHGSIRHDLQVKVRGVDAVYPDMKLYEEIIFLKHHFKGKWVVENVKPYYELLLPAQEIQRHMFWANFHIARRKFGHENLRAIQIPALEKLHGYDLSGYKLPNKRKVLRNCVAPELGLHVFNSGQGVLHHTKGIDLVALDLFANISLANPPETTSNTDKEDER